MAQQPKKSAPAAPPVRARTSRREREERRQRQIIMLSGIAIGVALLAVIVGVLYDQVYLPSQPVAQINGVNLSRGDYWRERRGDSAASISQAIFLTSFGPQFAQQAQGQISALENAIKTIRTEAVDQNLVEGWLDRQTVLQGAQQLGITVSDAEVAQLVDSTFGASFGPPPPVSGTPTITPTLAPTFTPQPTPTLTITPGGPTLTPAATFTPAPTFTPQPTTIPSATPLGDVALSNSETIYKNIYSRYLDQLAQIDPTLKAQLTEQDFKAGLFAQFQRQAYATKIGEQLVPDAGFTPSTDPSAIDTRHILIKVTVPVTATEQQREEAFAARRPEIDAIVQQLRAGSDFQQLATEKTEDFNTKEQGGTLPSFDKDGKTTSGTQIELALVQAVAALKDGEISDVIRTSFGWHVVQLASRTIDPRDQQLQAARTKAFDEWLLKQRGTAVVTSFPAVSPTPTALPTGTPAPLPTLVLGGDPSPTPLPTAPVPDGATPVPTAAASP
jgi:parvulin-like peptidyl-prolyl isomerase